MYNKHCDWLIWRGELPLIEIPFYIGLRPNENIVGLFSYCSPIHTNPTVLLQSHSHQSHRPTAVPFTPIPPSYCSPIHTNPTVLLQSHPHQSHRPTAVPSTPIPPSYCSSIHTNPTVLLQSHPHQSHRPTAVAVAFIVPLRRSVCTFCVRREAVAVQAGVPHAPKYLKWRCIGLH